MIDKFSSFRVTDKWLDRESHAILENDFGTVTVNEYCGMAAISFVPVDYSTVAPYRYETLRQENLCFGWMRQIEHTWRKIIGQHGTSFNLHGFMSNGVGVFVRE